MFLKLAILLAFVLVLLPLGGIVANGLPLMDPPGFVERIKRYLTTNSAETVLDSPFPELRPRRYPVSAERLLNVVTAAFAQLEWTAVVSDPVRGTANAVVRTPLWRFKDDIEVRVQSDPPQAAWLYVRSSSRLGRADLGANTRHILDLFAAVDGGLLRDKAPDQGSSR